jgi:origin recognition complex subunit 5
MDETFDIRTLSEANPGYEKFISNLFSAISCCNLPFIYVHDPVATRLTARVVPCVLQSVAQSQRLRYAQISAVACFTPRLLYDSILNSLADWHVSWDDDCENWTAQDHNQRWNESMDTFIHGLQAISKLPNEMGRKEKGKMQVTNPKDARMVIVFDRAEKLKETLPDHIVPLTRMAELVRVQYKFSSKQHISTFIPSPG